MSDARPLVPKTRTTESGPMKTTLSLEEDVFKAVKTDGMLCVRFRRGNSGLLSNHAWGTAIDLFFGKDSVPRGTRRTHRGNFLLFPFFNRHGWYWGAEFSGDSVDSMHFELAEETILKL